MMEHYKAFLTDLLKVFGFILNTFLFFRIVTYTFISVENLFIGFVLLMISGLIVFRIFRFQMNAYVFFFFFYLYFLIVSSWLITFFLNGRCRKSTATLTE